VTTDEITSILAPLIARLASPAQHRRFALALRQIADRQERLARAIERVPPTAPTAPRTPAARGQGRKPGMEIVIKAEQQMQTRTRVSIGRGLWFALRENIDNPVLRESGRVALRWSDVSGALWFEPCGYGDGWQVVIGSGVPRFFVNEEARNQLPPDGRYAGVVRGTRLTFGRHVA